MVTLPESRQRTFLAVGRRVVPELAALDSAGLERFLSIVSSALADRPAAVRRQVAMFLGVIRWLPLARWGRTFERLTAERQDRVLAWLQECPVGLLQRGFWGLKALVFMGYYGQPELWSAIGYAPVFDALERLHAGA
jgi:hypothetical protein